MRIQRSSSLKEYLAQRTSFVRGHRRSDLNRWFRDSKWPGRALVVASVTLGLALLVWAGSYAQVWRLILPHLRGWLDGAQARKNGLPTLYLTLDTGAYQALAMQRQQALRTGILLPADAAWIPAEVRLEGQTTPVRVRLAGSEPDGAPPVDHWAPSKWSLEVEVEGSGASGPIDMGGVRQVHEARGFSLLSPAMRGYLNGWLYAESLSRAGIPAPGYDLVNFSLNGEDWGIYALEEQPTTSLSALDAQQAGRYLAHADLWGARLPGPGYPPPLLTALAPPIVGPVLYSDPAVSQAYAHEAARITQPQYLRKLQRTYRRAFRRYHDALASEFFSAYLKAPWDVLAERQRALSVALQSGGPTTQDAFAAGGMPDVPPILSAMDLPPAPSMEEALARHPFLRDAHPGVLQVMPGTWRVEGDLVLPDGAGLQASEAFTLTFERGAALVVRGPLALHGPEGEGIHLLPVEDHWGGMVVLGAGTSARSVLENVEVRGARGIWRGDWQTTGGITFSDMPVLFHRCRVLDSYAPAAVHIVGASFEWVHSEFGAASGDFLRVRGARGSIERCAFHDTPGSAICTQESEVDVQDVSLLRVHETALWADQNSLVHARGLRARDVGIAVAAVDGSSVRIQDARVGQAHVAGLAAFREDTEDDPAIIEAAEVVFEDDSRPALVQPQSRITLDGLSVAAQDLEADELSPVADLYPPPETSPPLRPLHVRFGPSIWLVGYELKTPELAPGETVEVILYWRTVALLDRQYTVFMHLRDASGAWVTGWDMMPRYNTYPTTDWPVAELIDDVHIVPLSSGLSPGEYTIALGMYDWGTGERLPAHTRQGEAIPEAAVVLEERLTVK